MEKNTIGKEMLAGASKKQKCERFCKDFCGNGICQKFLEFGRKKGQKIRKNSSIY